MTSNPPHDEDLLDSAPVSADAITPRGGFMARPGLKTPPRHAVVVRGGDAPESEHIPVLRPSVPPPPPMSEAAPLLASEKITVRAIPTPTPPAPEVAAKLPVMAAPPRLESLPPPSSAPSSRAPLSDAPFVTSLLEPAAGLRSRSTGSRWTIIAAAAAGLLLGLVSVAVKLSAPGAAAQPSPADTLAAAAATVAPVQPAPALVDSSTPQRLTSPAPSAQRTEPKPSRPAPPTAKRTIF